MMAKLHEKLFPGLVFAPMAGQIFSILVDKGEIVEEGQPISILQDTDISDDDHHRIVTEVVCSPLAGQLICILVDIGMTVKEGQPILILRDPTTKVSPTFSKNYEISDIRRMLDETSEASLEGVLVDFNAAEYNPVATLGDQDVLESYKSFRKFDIVLDHSDHLFLGDTFPMKQPLPDDWAEIIENEWNSLQEGLPDKIFVRTYESRMDLLRAVIIGLERTPYHNGLFFFDVYLPEGYPHKPPLLRYHSGGLIVNPMLSKRGVHLTLPTTTNSVEELWVPGTSTLLQLLVSIQNKILCENFCDLGAPIITSEYAQDWRLVYRENTVLKSLKTMEYIMNNPPKNFEDFVVGHFRNHVTDILMACKKEASKRTCSTTSKHYFDLCFKSLVAAFVKIGAKEAQDFPPL